MKKKEFVWIYNNLQSTFYFSRGISPITTGVGTKGDAFVKFRNTSEVEIAFTAWCLKQY